MKVFVTRNEEWPLFREIAARGEATFTFQSCIRLSLLPEVDQPPGTDWIFFSSPSGVRLFLSRFSLPDGVRAAVLGEGTALALREAGIAPDFVPQTSDVRDAVEAFAEYSGGETVLYPRSTASLLRLRTAVTSERLIDFPFYLNSPAPPETATDADYLVFTSPSNAAAYLGEHRLAPGQQAVAIGESTASRLIELGVSGFIVSESPDAAGVWKAISEHHR